MTEYENASVEFRPATIWSSGRLGLVIAGVLIGLASSAINNSHFQWRNWRVDAAIAGFVALLLAMATAWHYLRVKGGVPALRFGSDRLAAPISVNTRRTLIVSYADIRSMVLSGRGKRSRVILDTRDRTLVYPLRALADPHAFERLRALLHERIAISPQGIAQWSQMEARAAVAATLSARQPWITWTLSTLLAVIYFGQSQDALRDPFFTMIRWGANAPSLVFHGQWFRLATANLMHATPAHLLLNTLSLLVIGTLVERQLSWLRFLVLVLATGLLCQLLSAYFSLHRLTYLYSVGASGIIFGALGGLAILNQRFGQQLPGGYRLSARTWWVFFFVNFVVVPMSVSNIDIAAHIGGLLAGAFVAWWLCRHQTQIIAPNGTLAAHSTALTILAVLWGVSLSMAAAHYFDASAAREDRTVLTTQALAFPHPKPAMDNAIAWSLVMHPDSTHEELVQALQLAHRATAEPTFETYAYPRNVAAYTDTLASVYYRLGDTEMALSLEEPLLNVPGGSYPSHYTHFLELDNRLHGVRRSGPVDVGIPALSIVSLKSSTLTFDFSVNGDLPQGAVIYAVALHRNALLGLMRVVIGRQAPRTVHLWARSGAFKSMDPSDLILHLAQVSSDCACAADTIAVHFYPYSAKNGAMP